MQRLGAHKGRPYLASPLDSGILRQGPITANRRGGQENQGDDGKRAYRQLPCRALTEEELPRDFVAALDTPSSHWGGPSISNRSGDGYRNVFITLGTATHMTSGHDRFYCGSGHLTCQAAR